MKYCFGNPVKESLIYWLRFSGGAPFYAILILALAIGKGAISRLLSTPTFVKLGDISYSIYMFNWIILREYTMYKNSFLNVPAWVSWCFYLLVVLATAYCNYTFIET